MLLFSQPQFPHLQNEHNYDWSHFIEKIINLHQFLNSVYQSHYISLAHSIFHSSRWLFHSFISFVKNAAPFPSSTLSTVNLASYFAKKEKTMKKYQHPPTITYSLTNLCLCSCTLPSCLRVSMTSLLFTEASCFSAPDPSPPFLLKDIISDFSLLFCIIRYLFLSNPLELSHQ